MELRPRDSAGADAASQMAASQFVRNVILDARHCDSAGHCVRAQAGMASPDRCHCRDPLTQSWQKTALARVGPSHRVMEKCLFGARSRREMVRRCAVETVPQDVSCPRAEMDARTP